MVPWGAYQVVTALRVALEGEVTDLVGLVQDVGLDPACVEELDLKCLE